MKRREFVATVSMALTTGVPDLATRRGAALLAPHQSNDAIAQNAHWADSLEFTSALAAAEAIRAKQVSSLELTEEMFSRIDKHGRRLNAFAYEMREEARARAKQLDHAQANGRSLGILHGVPVHVKESFAVAGHPCTWGIQALKGAMATEHSEVVSRLLGAGAVLVGGTNVPSYLWGPDKKIKLMLTYPMSTGRNFDEVLRVLDSMQLTAKHQVATPVNWLPGEDVIIAPSVSDDDAQRKYPAGWKAPRPYLRIIPQPK